MPSLVTLLPFVFELSSKNHRGGGCQNDPPPGRRLMSYKMAISVQNPHVEGELFPLKTDCHCVKFWGNDECLIYLRSAIFCDEVSTFVAQNCEFL